LRTAIKDSLWPRSERGLTPADERRLIDRLKPAFRERLHNLRIEDDLAAALHEVYLPLADWVARQKRSRPLVLGINGAQGAGKSTTCEFLQLILDQGFGLRVAGLSIDDLYKTRAEREALAHRVHPLLVTRGVPGTHDVSLGLATLQALQISTGTVAIPAFDKAVDDRRPESEWPRFQGPADVIVFEGWCVGARPQTAAELARPVNELEAKEDADGRWRRYVNDQLMGDYAKLFDRLDALIMLKVPDMASVYRWRSLQERKLAARIEGNPGTAQAMNDEALKRFIMHYERLTRHMLEEMPTRADITLCLNRQHQFEKILIKR
jgi:D-glycerate 3-kinase